MMYTSNSFSVILLIILIRLLFYYLEFMSKRNVYYQSLLYYKSKPICIFQVFLLLNKLYLQFIHIWFLFSVRGRIRTYKFSTRQQIYSLPASPICIPLLVDSLSILLTTDCLVCNQLCYIFYQDNLQTDNCGINRKKLTYQLYYILQVQSILVYRGILYHIRLLLNCCNPGDLICVKFIGISVFN